jgi:hypothetical protein
VIDWAYGREEENEKEISYQEVLTQKESRCEEEGRTERRKTECASTW